MEPYIFTRGQRGVFAEVYFPKKIDYQPEIFKTLKRGLTEKLVRDYLALRAKQLLKEMGEYPQLFDSDQYQREIAPFDIVPITLENARKRLEVYSSPFYGWSMYEVDGMFLNDAGHPYDERTQVIRLLFRFENPLKERAKKEKCYDVFEANLRWAMAEHNRLDHILLWSNEEQERFLKLHGAWPAIKLAFAEEHYRELTKAMKKWMDDIALFIFGYLVRSFWQEVTKLQLQEDEIWVTSFFSVNLNIVKQIGKEK